MFTKFSPDDQQIFPEELISQIGKIQTIEVEGIRTINPAEADTFSRHVGIPGHDQNAIVGKHIVMVGAGGLNGLASLGFLRSGATNLTVIDPDLVERSNLPRQMFFGEDRGQPKALRLIENLRDHAIAGATLTGIASRFEDAVENYTFPIDLLVIGVDRNDCRRYGAILAKRLGIPAIFTMLSTDGMRCQSFLQGSNSEDACLWCALPNLDPDRVSPCASAVITSCLLASAITVFFGHRILMGWPKNIPTFNFREADLLGLVPDRTALIQKRPACRLCGQGQEFY